MRGQKESFHTPSRKRQGNVWFSKRLQVKIRGLNEVTWMSEKLSLHATTPKITGDAIQFNHKICDTQPPRWPYLSHFLNVKKEFMRPGLHLRPVCADHARLPLQWTLNPLLSACGNDNGRIRPPPDRGILKITSRLLIA